MDDDDDWYDEDERDYDYDDKDEGQMIEIAVDGDDNFRKSACFAYLFNVDGEYVDYNRTKSIRYRVERTGPARDRYIHEWLSLANWGLDDYEVTDKYHIFSKKFESMRDRLVFFGFAHIPRGAVESDDMLTRNYCKLRNEVDVSADDSFILMNFVSGFGDGHSVLGSVWIRTLMDFKWQKWIDSIPWDIEGVSGYYTRSLCSAGPWLAQMEDQMWWYNYPPNWKIDKSFYERLKTDTFYSPYINDDQARKSPIYRPIGD